MFGVRHLTDVAPVCSHREENVISSCHREVIRMNVLMVVGREYERFLPDDLMIELKDLVDLTEHNGKKYDEDDYAGLLRNSNAEIVITGWASPLLTKRVADENPQLKYLCNITGGVRHAITREALESGILVTNWGGLIGKTVAEAALLSMLVSLRKTVHVAKLMQIDRGWKRDRSLAVESLYHQSIGLHGFGNIARTLVGLLAPFACDISAYDPFIDDEVFAAHNVTRVTDLESLYANNRIVSIHAPKIDETFHVVDASLLARMQDRAILINTARGNIIDTAALISELVSGRISASLDVYEDEPLSPESPLRDLDNCHLTPHTAGPTKDRYIDFGRLAVDNVRRFVNAEPLEYPVDVVSYDRMT